MSTRDRAATWDNRAEAEAVATELNERDRQPEYGALGEDDWIVVDDREARERSGRGRPKTSS